MKSHIYAFFFLVLLSSVLDAQSQWYNQNSGTNTYLFDVHFVDQYSGWIAGNTGLILHTSDGGANWNEQTAPANNTYYSIFFTDSQHGWAGGFGGKLIRTTDGGNTWIDGSAGTNRFRYDLYFINADSGWVVGGDNGVYPTFTPNREIYFTSNGGISWTAQYTQSGESPLFAVYFIDKNNGFAVGESGAVMRTTNGGGYWYESSTLTGYHLSDVCFVNANIGWIIGQYLGLPHVPGIFLTTDGGTTWNVQTFGVDESFSSISFSDEMNGWVVGGTTTQSFILNTTDGGTTWNFQNSPTDDFLVKVNFFNNHGWAVGEMGAVIATVNTVPVELISFNASVEKNNVILSWKTATETNNSGFEIYRSRQNNNFENIGFVAGKGTTTEETNYLFNDKYLQSGHYSYKLVQIDFDGTRNESELISIEIIEQPNEYSLEQNYPNPFNPTTTINYSIPTAGNVQLKIFNALGEEVKILIDEFKGAGSYEINFNAASFPSGVYYYRLESEEFVSLRKMILLK